MTSTPLIEPKSKVRVKVCCVRSPWEARYCTALGANFLGLITSMPGPGVIADSAIQRISSRISPGVESVLLSALADSDGIIEQQRRFRTTALQLMIPHSIENLRQLRRELPGVRLLQVISVTDRSAIARATEVAPMVDGLILDSADPSRGELGATGRTHDWSVSRAIRDAVDVPVLLGGGLNSANVEEAINVVQPYAVDVCTGVRDPEYYLAPSRLESFMAVVDSLRTLAPGQTWAEPPESAENRSPM